MNSETDKILDSLEKKAKSARKRQIIIGSSLGFSILLIIVYLVFLPFDLDIQNASLNDQSSSREKVYDCLNVDKETQYCIDRNKSMKLIDGIEVDLKDLSKKNVEVWNNDLFNKVSNSFEIANRSFMAKKYSKSLEELTISKKMIDKLIHESEIILKNGIELGFKLLLRGESEDATEKFKEAALIEKDNAKVMEGLYRSEVYSGIILKINKGQELIKLNQLDEAQKEITGAYLLDQKNPEAQKSFKFINNLILDRNFSKAIYIGQRAINDLDEKKGIPAFRSALKMKPNSIIAKKGLEKILLIAKQNIIKNSIIKGQKFEKQESWVEALNSYQTALDEDKNILLAQEGFNRVSKIQDIKKRVEFYLSNSDRLSQPKILSDALNLNQESEDMINEWGLGSEFIGLKNSLYNLIGEMSEPIAVHFFSDNKTIIQITRIGEFGPFSNQELFLKPGNYEIIGRRKGFVEKRYIFKVGGFENSIEIICDEPI